MRSLFRLGTEYPAAAVARPQRLPEGGCSSHFLRESLLYPQRFLRPYADIDLLIRPCDEAEALAVLGGAGFRELPDSKRDRWRNQQQRRHDVGAFHRRLVSHDTQSLVELHCDSLQLGLTPRCESGRWHRAVSVPDIKDVLMLCAEDQLVQLSVHAHKHGWERLIWLKDLDLLSRGGMSPLNWKLTTQIARVEGVQGSLWYSLLLARTIFDSPVPAPILERLRPPGVIRHLYTLAWPVSQIHELRGKMRRRAVQFDPAQSFRGMLPGLLFMGRRYDRVRAIAGLLRSAAIAARSTRPDASR